MVDNREAQFSELLVGKNASIRKALSLIDEHRLSSVVVVEDNGVLAGVVTEADVHRALLDGRQLDEPVHDLVRKPIATAKSADSRAQALDLMRALRLTEVPIVDETGVVVGMHVEDALLGAPVLDNWAVIMAGGRGTRLAPLTKTVPKPMLPVAGRPILERLVLHLVGSGVKKIFLSVNYLADIIEKHFQDGSQFGCMIEYLREDVDRPLGTGGALRVLGDLGYEPTAPLLVMNGDLITDFSVAKLLESHRCHRSAATIAVSAYQHQVPFGVLEAEDDQLVRIVEKPTNSWSVNAGIYVVEPHLLSWIPDVKLYPITRLFDDCLDRGERVGLWPINEDWQDIGRPAELAQARGQA